MAQPTPRSGGDAQRRTGAVIGPPRSQLMSAERFRELIASAPAVDEEFAAEMRALRNGEAAGSAAVAILIDTDVLVDLERDAASAALEELLGDEERAVSVITVSELLHGVHRATGAHRTRRSAFVEHVLAGLDAIPITEPVARMHAGILVQLAERGDVIGAYDLWIAATALAHGLGVATRNVADYGRVPGLRVLAAPA